MMNQGATESKHLPNFIVVGAAKAGTTSLHHYLSQHPEIFLPEKKESYYFLSSGQSVSYEGPWEEDKAIQFFESQLGGAVAFQDFKLGGQVQFAGTNLDFGKAAQIYMD